MASFSNMMVKGKAYDCCSACSDGIVNEYRKSGWEFVKRALNEKGYVEEVSGLGEVQRIAERMDEEGLEWEEDEEGELIG